MLVGEPVGVKTAVVEGLARLIELEPERFTALAQLAHRPTSNGRHGLRAQCCAAAFEGRIKAVS